jgi:predicted ATPase
MSTDYRLVIITGQEGVGKSTIVPALLPYAEPGAALDAEEIGQVNPWEFDDAFKELLWDNVAAIVHNFWQAGYATVIAGSFINDYADYARFRPRLKGDVDVCVVQLCASKAVRDQRRIARPKPTSKERRDTVDRSCPEDTTLCRAAAEFRYVRIENTALSVAEVVDEVRQALPDVFRLG